VASLAKLLESYSFKSVLARGYAVVRDAAGEPVTAASALATGQPISLQFTDGKVGARVEQGSTGSANPRTSRRRRDDGQGSLL